VNNQPNSRVGKLKIYFGYAVGVGKTYAMLTEAHELLRQGVDVIIGYVEPHERSDTIEKMVGLETVPPAILDPRHDFLREADIPGIINRRPKIVLMDEIAHSNAPGSANLKRYQDIAELLQAGIDVITTLNAQHLESLAPTVEEDLSIKVSERIPDNIISSAEAIINIDLSVKDLIKRIKAGKVYHQSQIERALNNFARSDNLNYLRKLALGWLKQHKIAGR
jgi:two-component system, OmpR family, sensor histidine kinase KdpD